MRFTFAFEASERLYCTPPTHTPAGRGAKVRRHSAAAKHRNQRVRTYCAAKAVVPVDEERQETHSLKGPDSVRDSCSLLGFSRFYVSHAKGQRTASEGTQGTTTSTCSKGGEEK